MLSAEEYGLFETAQPFSQEWNSVEMRVLSRAFLIKRIRILSRGSRKNQIEVVSPGSGQRPSNLGEGIFEWAVALEAFEVYRKLHPLESDGFLTPFFYHNPLHGKLKHASTNIGTLVGFAAAIWNDLGSKWPDLWDYYRQTAMEDNTKYSNSFIQFYKIAQSARLLIPSIESLQQLTEAIVEKMRQEISKSKTFFLNRDSSMIRILKACGVQNENINDIKNKIRKWQFTKDLWSTYYRESIDVDNVPQYGAENVKDIEDVNQFFDKIRGVAEVFEKDNIKEHLQALLSLLELSGIELELDKTIPSLGRFDVYNSKRGNWIELTPRISLKNSLTEDGMLYRLALCHEIGHFVNHNSWIAELCLADIVVQFFHKKDMQIVLKLIELQRSIRKRLVLNYSAIETAADEFAVEVLLPKQSMNALYDICNEARGFRLFDFHNLARLSLGIKQPGIEGIFNEDRDLYADRFWNIVEDRAPNHINIKTPISSGRELRMMCRKVSEQRVTNLLTYFWEETESIIAGESSDFIIGKPRQSKGQLKSGVYFEGIICDDLL